MSYMYDDAVRDYARKAKRNNYKKLTHDVYLYERGGLTPYYSVRLFSTDIVDIYPDHQVLHAGGWHTMRTCKEMNEWSTLGWGATLVKGSIRINAPYAPRGSLPFHNGMRIDNSGRVFMEDRLPDEIEKTKPEVVREWKKLTMPLTRNVRSRCAIGEFNDVIGEQKVYGRRDREAIAVLEDMDPEYPDHAQVRDLMMLVDQRSGKRFERTLRTPIQRWEASLSMLRPSYYQQNDGYMTIEVPNV